ncbi:ACH_G0035000.mRNA.1.CDS.1 [Saccharomyces cerevisiae]|nr:ACH_G0035000.mRNA.1.CDS.1 [Saccharomyces cerevisiae]CAI6789344.1 ACH_G0035000.mRNA.1.CDS.1 [Saccharomyces cerevisiae]
MNDQTQFTERALTILTLAQKLASDHQHPQLQPIHILAAFIETPEDGSVPYLQNLIEKGRYDYDLFKKVVNRNLVRIPQQQPAPAEITPSYALGKVLQDAAKIQKQQKDSFIAQDHILFALFNDSSIQQIFKEAQVDIEAIKQQALELRGNTRIDSRGADTNTPLEYLSKYAIDMTEQARQGKLDPVIGREEEIRSTIRVLARRIKSNPCLIGEPGIGKTAIIEGVAQRIIDDDVPIILQGAKLFSLDLAALTAGAKYKGDFEERFKGVLKEIEESKTLIVLFIDEIHMLMGNGKDDAANILKPALSRGQLKVIGATTNNEYRSIVEKDGAFERRFQKIEVAEPSVRQTVAILRGLQPKYEIHHGVRILDSALVTAAQLAKRYLPYRRLPDSALDLVDISCAGVAVARDSKPEELDSKERQLQLIQVEIKALERDEDADSTTKDRLKLARQKEASLQEELEPLRQRYNEEKHGHEELTQAKKKLDELENKALDAERRYDTATAADLRYFAIPDIKKQIEKLEDQVAEEERRAGANSMIQNVVDSDTISETAARLTGIPVKKLSESENEKLIHMERDLSSEVVGQMDAIKAVSNAVRLSRSGLANPRQPASFLFLGLSGSGKTELAKKVAGFLFNDEDMMIRVDCSELSEKYAVSKLLGTTAGYVGYDEGGFLTNQLQYKPYSVLLFDEVEKAHPDVLTVMLQMLDDGRITSGQGKTIDCSNCIVIMTSNLGAEFINSQQGSKIQESTKNLVMGAVRQHFRPEFLNRISSIVIFNKLSRKAIHKIVDIRLKEIEERFEQNDKHYKLNLTQEAKDFLAKYGYSDDMGARPLNRLIQNEILNKLALRILKNEIKDKETVNVVLKKGKSRDENVPEEAEECLEVLPNHEATIGADTLGDDDNEDSMEIDDDLD